MPSASPPYTEERSIQPAERTKRPLVHGAREDSAGALGEGEVANRSNARTATRACPQCRRATVCERPYSSWGGWDFFALLLTAGLWLPARLLWAAWRKPWRCTVCTNRLDPLGKSLARAAGIGFATCLAFWIAIGFVARHREQVRQQELHAKQEAARARAVAEQERRAERAAQAEAHRAQLTEELAQRRPEIVAGIQSALREGDFRRAVQEAQRYAPLSDPEIGELAAVAQSRMREADLVAKAAELPASDLAGNEEVYAELIRLAPGNRQYKAKLAHYAAQLAEEQRREAAERAQREERLARFGEPPTPSAWDGSYLPVKQYLKQVANDPDSIKIDGCTKVYHSKDGWLVGCNYRGRNGFGGMIRTANWFTIRHGQVIAMHESDAYRE